MFRFTIKGFYIVFFLFSIAFGKSNDELKNIVNGISQNADMVKNITFDYSIEHKKSERWKTKDLERLRQQLADMRQQLKGERITEQQFRFVYEDVIRTGTFVKTADAFKITNKMTAASDNQVFFDELLISDGVKITKIDIKENSALISYAKDYRNSNAFYFPDNFQNLFLDGGNLLEVFETNDVNVARLGRQAIEGVECDVLEIIHFFKTPEGIKTFTKDRVWIATQNNYLIKQGISYSTDPNTKTPINSIMTEFKEVAEGIWYYSDILFTSFPYGDTTPDVTMLLTLNNIKINENLPDGTFKADLSNIKSIIDKTK